MAYFIYDRDDAGLLILNRSTRDAAERKARKLDEMCCFEIKLIEEADAQGGLGGGPITLTSRAS